MPKEICLQVESMLLFKSRKLLLLFWPDFYLIQLDQDDVDQLTAPAQSFFIPQAAYQHME